MNALALVNNQNALINQNNDIVNIDNSVSVLNKRWENINNNLRMTNIFMVQINNMVENVDKSMESAEEQSTSFLSKVKEIGKSIFTLSNAKLVFNATIVGAAKAREQLIGFQNLMGDKAVGKEYLDKISKDSIQKGFSPDDAVNNTRGFMKVTKNTDKLDSLNSMAARLATTNPSKGVGDSGAAIQSAMSGKFDDLQNKFNFSEADTQILKGSTRLEEFMSKMDELLNKKGLTAQNLVDFSESPLAQVNQFKNNIDDALSSSGEKALDILTPIMVKFNKAFANGYFECIFNGIAVALNIVAFIALGVADIFSGIGMIIRENWGTIQQILVFAAGMLSAVLVPMLWQKVTAIWANVMALLAEAQAWMLANIQIMLIVGAIFILIYILIQCGVTFEQIIGFIGGLVGVFFGYLYNRVAYIWNIFASLAEFLANLFTNPLYATKALFVNIWNGIVGFVGRALDAIVGMIKKIPFLGDKIGDFSVVDKLTMDIEDPPKDYIKVPKMEMKNYDNEFSYGYGKGASFGRKIDSGISGVINKFSAINKNEDKDVFKN